MTIRRSMAALAVVVASLLGSGSLLAAEPCALCAVTDGGIVQGIREGAGLAFKGIPYAAPPIGALRFRPPQPVEKWQGTLEATRFRSTCPQVKDPLERYPYEPSAHTDAVSGETLEVYENEDCLHLNVWTPAVDGKKRPVMVFIPGGAFIVGNGSSDFYTGQHLARRDVVVVALNYRVGLFGFMELGKLDPSYMGSGNNGLRDQIAALEWVKRNAQAFGGDPDNITVFGESAGSISITALLATANPESLFHRAIAQSGGVNLIHTRDFAFSAAALIGNSGKLKTLAQLLKASALELLNQQTAATLNAEHGDSLFAPYRDGQLVVGNPNQLIPAGHAKGIDLMVGANQNEMNYWSLYDSKQRNPFTEQTDLGPAAPIIPDELRSHLDQALAPASLDALYAESLKTRDQSLIRQAQNDDFVMIQPMTRLAEMQAAHNPNTYLYRFQWKVPLGFLESGQPDLGATHALELPFVFGTLDLDWVPGGGKLGHARRQEEQLLASQMMDAWTNFARTGNPNGKAVPHWPRYDSSSRQTMLWSTTPGTKVDPDASRRQAWANWPFGLFPDGL